jgi:hypothetical protein
MIPRFQPLGVRENSCSLVTAPYSCKPAARAPRWLLAQLVDAVAGGEGGRAGSFFAHL